MTFACVAELDISQTCLVKKKKITSKQNFASSQIMYLINDRLESSSREEKLNLIIRSTNVKAEICNFSSTNHFNKSGMSSL